MPVSKSKLDQLNAMLDDYLEQREKDRLAGIDDDEDDDPVQFLETPRTLPVSEPPAEPRIQRRSASTALEESHCSN
jgi:hypothetical protein